MPTQEIHSAGTDNLTPLMQQYRGLKARYADGFLFFRLGDFYELFDEDAKTAAPLLEVVLTQRQGTPMCGVPVHAVEGYLAKLLKAGRRIAIAEQMEDPALAKGLVKREVVRVVTPGTVVEDNLLEAKRGNYLAAFHGQKDSSGTFLGAAFLDCSTGDFCATEFHDDAELHGLKNELARFSPTEILFPAALESNPGFAKFRATLAVTRALPNPEFSRPQAESALERAIGAERLAFFRAEEHPLAAGAAVAVLRYVETARCGRPLELRTLRFYARSDRMVIDARAIQHLELVENAMTRTLEGSLLGVLDFTRTAAGGRLLRSWLLAPRIDKPAIEERLDRVELFVEDGLLRRAIRDTIASIADIERILARLSHGTAGPRDLIALAGSLRAVGGLHRELQRADKLDPKRRSLLEGIARSLPERLSLSDTLAQALVDAPPTSLKEGGVIREGYDPELDELRALVRKGKAWLVQYETREKERTGITSLKVGYNAVFGYFIEVTRPNLTRVPPDYIRKQTLANAERFITPELKEYESKILGAEERIVRLESALFQTLCETIAKDSATLGQVAQAAAELDVWVCLAEAASRYGYARPQIEEGALLSIREGRHPVAERLLPAGQFVANDLSLDGLESQILILTGPNMSGKSTYLRQTALLVIMAQMGSFVPAAEARVGLVDRIFTRIGAADDVARGESTFMVEMTETANILRHATPRSLIILDEVGRGTSTDDGIAIAWACLEHLARGPKVLFATHYFELTALARQIPSVKNFHVEVKEWGEEVIFLHRILPGPTDRAYGIHVARLAGLPLEVIRRAQELVGRLEP